MRARRAASWSGGIAGLVACAAIAAPATAPAYVPPPAGVLTQLSGTSGCVLEPASDGCAGGFSLNGAAAVAVSPDGSSVYSGSLSGSGSIAVFDRSPGNGALTQKPAPAGCLNANGDGGCAAVTGLGGVTDIEVSPDGQSVYVSAIFASSLVVFDRDPATGALTQKPGAAGCIVSDQPPRGPCTEARAVGRAAGIALSPDGSSL